MHEKREIINERASNDISNIAKFLESMEVANRNEAITAIARAKKAELVKYQIIGEIRKYAQRQRPHANASQTPSEVASGIIEIFFEDKTRVSVANGWGISVTAANQKMKLMLSKLKVDGVFAPSLESIINGKDS